MGGIEGEAKKDVNKYPYRQAATVMIGDQVREITAHDVYKVVAGRDIFLSLDMSGRLRMHCIAGPETERVMRTIRLWLRSPTLEALILLNLEAFADRHDGIRRLWETALDNYRERQAILAEQGTDLPLFDIAVFTARHGPEPKDVILGEEEAARAS